MFSDHTRQTKIYPALRLLLYIISIPVAFSAMMYYNGTAVEAAIYEQAHPQTYLLSRIIPFALHMLVFSLLLFGIGKMCNRKVPSTTYAWLALPPLIAFFFILVNMGYQA